MAIFRWRLILSLSCLFIHPQGSEASEYQGVVWLFELLVQQGQIGIATLTIL